MNEQTSAAEETLDPAAVHAQYEQSKKDLAAAWERSAATDARLDVLLAKTRAMAPLASSTVDSEIHGAQTRLGQAQATYEREHAALYRADGQPRYGETEHGEHLAAMQERLDAVISGAQETADRIIGEQDVLLTHLQGGDALDSLDTVEQMAANTRRAFIKEDAETLPAADLITRCRAVLAGTDRATQYVLGRYVGQRVAAANAEAGEASREGRVGEMAAQDRLTLGALAEELRTKVRGSEGAREMEVVEGHKVAAVGLHARAAGLYDAAHDRRGQIERELRASGRYSI